MREPLRNAEKRLVGFFPKSILTILAIFFMAITLNAQSWSISDECTCLSNQSREGDGQFSATIVVSDGGIGADWYIVQDSISGFYDITSADPPAQPTDYQTGVGGVHLTETPANSGEFELDGIHIDGQGFWVEVTDGNTVLRIILDAGHCEYPKTKIAGDPFVCEGQISDYGTVATYAGSTYHWDLTNNSAHGGTMDPANGNAHVVTITWDDESDGIAHNLKVTETSDNGCVVSDEIDVVIEDTITMACNNNVQISLDHNCAGALTADMFLEDPQYNDASYNIIIEDSNGNLINQDTLSKDMVGKTYTITVQHDCSGNMCWAYMLVLDKTPPELNCHTDTIKCSDSIDPFELNGGFPIEVYTSITPTGNDREYIAKGTTSCTDLTLKYYDEIKDQPCGADFASIVVRKWIVSDASSNLNTCIDTIKLERASLADMTYPECWDGQNGHHAIIEACSVYKKNSKGNPDTSYTGSPSGPLCGNIMVSYIDRRLYLCGEGGKSYTVLRKWIVMDMCTTESFDTIQMITVKDTKKPYIYVPGLVNNTLNINTSYYNCGSDVKLPVPRITDCSIDATNPSYFVGYHLPDENGDFPDLTFPYTTLHKIGNSYTLPNITGGKARIKYTAVDECGNIGEKIFYIKVHDNLPPQAVCDKHTTITLSDEGIGYLEKYTFDDGSYDNCTDVTLKVRRMDNTCDNSDIHWGEGVHFCCLDSGKDSIAVSLLVTDENGLTNTCMSLVRVMDNERPKIHCPSNGKVSCKFNYSDLSVFGTVRTDIDDVKKNYINDPENGGKHLFGIDGYATDNCDVTIKYLGDSKTISNCGVGKIYRRFQAVDNFGNKSNTCTQTITVTDFRPFNANNKADLIWPKDYPNYTGCYDAGILPDNLPTQYGWPKIIGDDHCSQIAVDYDDLVFEHIDGMCKKILRKWRVIDWCNYVENNTGYTKGYWEHTQVIMLNDNDLPVVESGCTPTEVTPLGNCLYKYHFKASGSDNCTPNDELEWSYKLNVNQSNTNVVSGNTDEFTINLSKGTHKITWYLEDECGNIGTCSEIFTVKDEKAPTPQCIDGLVTVLLPETGKITIYAADFNRNSTDDCTRSGYGSCGCLSDLKFSFSNNSHETSKLLSCSDIENGILDTIKLEMWVTDESGNQDFCNTFIILQDNSDVCPDVIPPHDTTFANLYGKIIKPNNTPVTSANLDLINTVNDEINYSKSSNNEGEFVFKHLADNLSYNLTASKTGDDLNGLSTLDIVFIQKHLLSIKKFKNPYQYIAADINNSGKISASDILELRKMVLGINNKFTNNSSWKFIDKDYIFANSKNPFNFEESINIEQIKEDTHKDIIAVKIGDINNSALTGSNGLVFRNDNHIDLITDNIDYSTNDFVDVNIYSQEEFITLGTQFTIKFTPTYIDFIDIESGQINLTDVNINTALIKDGIITVSWNTPQGIEINTNNKLFKLRFKAMKNGTLQHALNLNSDITKAEIYTLTENEIVENNLKLDFRGSENYSFKVFQNVPNPFNSKTTIGFEIPEEQEVTLQVYDVTGKTLYSIEKTLSKGYNEFEISNEDIKTTGLMYYKLKAGTYSAIRKMILIK